jgi:hypothetical protein
MIPSGLDVWLCCNVGPEPAPVLVGGIVCTSGAWLMRYYTARRAFRCLSRDWFRRSP